MSETTKDALIKNVEFIRDWLSEGYVENLITEAMLEDDCVYDEISDIWTDEDGEEIDRYTVDDLSVSPAESFMSEQALDVDVIATMSGKQYRGVIIAVSVGGPHIEVNTLENNVHGYWGGEHVTRRFIDGFGLDDYCAEMWEWS